MTLTLTPDTEMRLRAVAEGQGLELTDLHDAILTQGLQEAEARLQAEAEAELQDTLAGLDRSMADVAAGRWMTSEELDRRLKARSAAAHARVDEAKIGRVATVKMLGGQNSTVEATENGMTEDILVSPRHRALFSLEF